MKRILLFLVLAAGSTCCVNIEKQISQGRYDEAISNSIDKLQGKAKKKTKYVVGLEDAFKKALNRDLSQIENLKSSNPADADLKIVRLLDKIEKYQSTILPLLPLKDKDGYEAKFNFKDISSERKEHQELAGNYLLQEAKKKLETKDKKAAREAYTQLQEYKKITGSTSTLLTVAKEAGISYFIVFAEIGDKISLSRNAADAFLNVNVSGLDRDWQIVHNREEKNRSYDYEVVFTFDNFEISPEKENTREYQDKKEIDEDTGRKDREGKKIYRKKEVKADVIEVYQFKEIIAKGELFIIDRKTKKEVFKDGIIAKKTFENYASTFKGDKQALSDISLRRIGGKPLPFPKNELMLQDVIQIIQDEHLAALKKQYTKY